MRFLFATLLLSASLLLRAVEPELTAEEGQRLELLRQLAEDDPAAAASQLAATLGKDANPALLYALAVFRYQAGDAPAALQPLEDALAAKPDFTRARRMLATLHVSLGNHAIALPHLQRLVAIGDQEAATDWRLLAWTLLALDQPLAAETAIRQALIHAPDDPELVRALLQALMLQERWLEAEPLARRALARDPSQPDLWQLRVNAALQDRDQEKALLLLQSMRMLAVADSTALLMLGDLLLDQRLYEAALDTYREADALDAGAPPERLLQAAEGLLSLERLAEAEALVHLLQPRQESLPSRHQARLLGIRGAFAAAAGDDRTALDLYRQAIDQAPANGRLLLYTAPLLAKAGETDEAKRLYERAIRLGQPHAWHARIGLARLLVEDGDLAAGADQLRQALELHHSPAIARYLQQLRQQLP